MKFFQTLLTLVASASAAPQLYPSPLPQVVQSSAVPAYSSLAYHAPAAVYHAPVAAAPTVAYHAPAVVSAPSAPVVPILSQSSDSSPDGSYNFHYESADGSSRSESGAPGGVAVQGSYSYVGPEGPVNVNYLADENGFQPSGPNVHPEIQKAVAEQVAFARANPLPQSAVPVSYHAPAAVYHAPVPVSPPVSVAYHAPVGASYPGFHAKA